MKRNDKKEYNDITKISRKRIQLFKILQIIIHLECFRFLSILQYSFLFLDWRIYQISHSHSHQILFILISILKILLNNNISLSSERVQLPYTIPFTNINIPITILLSFIIHDDPFFIIVWILYHLWGESTINSTSPSLIFTQMIGKSLFTSNLTFTQNWNTIQFNTTIHIPFHTS